MIYLGYFEVIEASGWCLSNDLDKLKKEWSFNTRIFKVNGLTQEEINEMPKPRYPTIAEKFKLIYSDGGDLMHEEEVAREPN